MRYIALQKFLPKEFSSQKICIWCKSEVNTNNAHIISKKLTIRSHNSAILKKSVCQKCNNSTGKIEEWILKNTPIGWIRFFLYYSANKKSNSSIPSYFFSPNLSEWLVYRIDGSKGKNILTQFILSETSNKITVIVEDNNLSSDMVVYNLIDKIKKKEYIIDIKKQLPASFSSRFIIDNGKVVLISLNSEKATKLLHLTDHEELFMAEKTRLKLSNYNKDYTHFKWSKLNWAKFCTKISFETLSLFEGADFCLNKTFDQVRKFINEGPGSKYIEIIFKNDGPIDEVNTPKAVYLDLTVSQNAPLYKDIILGHCDLGMHLIVIFEIDGWIYSSTAIAGMQPSLFILGGPEIHLKDFYQLIYDEKEDQFDYYKLAYEPRQPVYPMQLRGDFIKKILRTYKY